MMKRQYTGTTPYPDNELSAVGTMSETEDQVLCGYENQRVDHTGYLSTLYNERLEIDFKINFTEDFLNNVSVLVTATSLVCHSGPILGAFQPRRLRQTRHATFTVLLTIAEGLVEVKFNQSNQKRDYK